MLGILTNAGFKCYKPQGAYYIMTDISRFNAKDDIEFGKYLIEEIGVAVVPGSSFYNDPASGGSQQVRFAYCKVDETLRAAGERLAKLQPK
jgi:aminotransferase